ncbi:MAG: polyamine aminopropyltransferase [Syntrophales bacterium]|nr:polyamine aminopropyltransferase [Syntrophales bacterium]
MHLWFTESDIRSFGPLFKVKRTLCLVESKFQKIAVYETPELGRLLVIDGLVMSCEYDEFAYHEMLAHVPLYVHPNPKYVLIIGGGDGGTLREVVKHETVEKVDLVEIDEEVIKITREFLPGLASAFDHPKVTICIMDGYEYVKCARNLYDVILVDGSDPVGPAERLFSQEFFELCRRILNDEGVFVSQTESPYDVNLKAHVPVIFSRLRAVFPRTMMYLANVSTYPSGLWSFAFSSDRYDPIEDFRKDRFERDGLVLKYYNADIHRAAFVLPNFVREIIGSK